jgi:glycine cleavage system transcriptional repressor
MPYPVRISIVSRDDRGLLHLVAARLFEMGGDLGDATFAVLGEEASFACVCELPDEVKVGKVEEALAALPGLAEADIEVRRFDLATEHGPLGRVTHQVVVWGRDQPGLVARLCEAFPDHGANIVRLHAEQMPGDDYLVRIEAHIPSDRASACLADVANTAEQMSLKFEGHEAGRSRG